MSVSVTSPLNTRGGLLAVWVQCKQLLQQAIPPKTFGLDEVQYTVLSLIIY